MASWLVACGGAAPTGGLAAEEPSKETSDAEQPGELGAVSLPELRSCVSDCERTSVGSGERDCRTDCHSSCLAQCDREASERPLAFKKHCRDDCDRQLDRL